MWPVRSCFGVTNLWSDGRTVGDSLSPGIRIDRPFPIACVSVTIERCLLCIGETNLSTALLSWLRAVCGLKFLGDRKLTDAGIYFTSEISPERSEILLGSWLDNPVRNTSPVACCCLSLRWLFYSFCSSRFRSAKMSKRPSFFSALNGLEWLGCSPSFSWMSLRDVLISGRNSERWARWCASLSLMEWTEPR